MDARVQIIIKYVYWISVGYDYKLHDPEIDMIAFGACIWHIGACIPAVCHTASWIEHLAQTYLRIVELACITCIRTCYGNFNGMVPDVVALNVANIQAAAPRWLNSKMLGPICLGTSIDGKLS